ncbi:MAG: hypothetical protein WA900_04650 [Casimicrobiaceae bacterium]
MALQIELFASNRRLRLDRRPRSRVPIEFGIGPIKALDRCRI